MLLSFFVLSSILLDDKQNSKHGGVDKCGLFRDLRHISPITLGFGFYGFLIADFI